MAEMEIKLAFPDDRRHVHHDRRPAGSKRRLSLVLLLNCERNCTAASVSII
jgi:hypothetical protein